MCSRATQRGMAVCVSNEHSRFHWSGRGFSSAQLCNCSTWVGEGVVRRKREGFPSVQCNGAQGPLILCTSSEGLKGRVRKALPHKLYTSLERILDVGCDVRFGRCVLVWGRERRPTAPRCPHPLSAPCRLFAFSAGLSIRTSVETFKSDHFFPSSMR